VGATLIHVLSVVIVPLRVPGPKLEIVKIFTFVSPFSTTLKSNEEGSTLRTGGLLSTIGPSRGVIGSPVAGLFQTSFASK